MITQAGLSPSFRQQFPSSHLHIEGDICPMCEQEIPPEKLEEIRGKIAKKEIEKERAIKVALDQQYTLERAHADAKAKADLELEQQRSVIREQLAVDEARKTAEADANEKLTLAQRSREELQAALQNQVNQTETAKKAAETTRADLETQLQQIRHESEIAISIVTAAAEAREANIRTEALQAAEGAVAEKVAASEAARTAAEAGLLRRIADAEETKAAAEQKGTTLQARLDEVQRAKEAEIEKLKEEAAAAEGRIKQEAATAAELLVQAKIKENEKALVDALAKASETEDKLSKLAEQHDAVMNERLTSQREILEKAKDAAINAEKSKAYEENLKLSTKVGELQRALEKKSSEELGEGAEIDLFDALKKEFPDDDIQRVAKGAPGADIIHVVMHNRMKCGTIIYDSKNHNLWRNDHVTKLRADQLAAKAEHAVLSTYKFPAGARHLHTQDGVLLASPARVISVVILIRQHVLQVHTLRVSSAERESKTEALYAFITSERCTQLFTRIESHAEELLDQQVKDKKQHEAIWKKEGELIRSIQKVNAEMANEISGIIGTTAEPEMSVADVL
jgi:hypothetical protein